MENHIHFAFIGCGKIAQKHYAALIGLPNARISAVCDVRREVAEAFGKKYAIPWYTDPFLMCERERVDILNILTPSGDHGKRILELIPCKKDFVIEKPLALNLEEVDQVLAQCDSHRLRLFVVQQNRFNPPIQALKRAIDKGRFGKLVLGNVRVRWCRRQEYYDDAAWRGTWAMDGGVLTNQASHHIDMLLWLMGEAESVMAKIATRLVNIEAEDTGVAILKFRNGALGTIETTTATRPKDLEGSISILGEGGSVEVGGFFMNKLVTWNFEKQEPEDATIMQDYGSVPSDNGWNHREYFKNILENIQENKRALVDGFEGRKSIELINALYESAETGKEVFLRFRPRLCKLGVAHE